VSGPFETVREARDRVRHIYDAARATSRRGVMGEANHRMLCEALTAADVELGAYDHGILQRLAGWESQTCAVVAGWITQAHQAGGAP
jgi:hypothetical protein